MGERRVEYDTDTARQQQQLTGLATLSGSVAAIIGHMVAATEGFDIRQEDHRKAVKLAMGELMKPWFESVLKAQATLGREKLND
jgi:hypothetical protein